jgi:hypothetical protein
MMRDTVIWTHWRVPLIRPMGCLWGSVEEIPGTRKAANYLLKPLIGVGNSLLIVN